jgi:cytochrome c peroxidase
MKRVAVALAVWLALAGPLQLQAEEGVIDLAALPNYAKQVKPSYIFWNNTRWDNPTTNTGATLGRLLFYDKRLSRNNTVSCSSCHLQAFAFGNPAVAGTGVNGMTDRHPMRLVNARFALPQFFSDRRAETLESAVTRPLHSAIEMGFSGTNGDPDFAELLAKLSTLPEYQILFRAAFGSPAIDETSIQKALSQFIRSIESFDSKYDAGAVLVPSVKDPFPNFTESENRGKQLFITDPTIMPSRGGAGCAGCHLTPHFATSATWNNGVVTKIGGGTDFTVTKAATLRDLVNPSGELNGPMMHDGSFTSIAQVINHYAAIPPGIQNTSFPQGQTLNLTPQDRVDLEAFLRTLSGKAVYTDPKWSNPFRPDGTITVKAIDPPASQAVNLSTRMRVLTGNRVGIGGFIINGVAPKRVLVRALGPSLAKFGLPTLLADPTITLNGPAGFAPIVNDNWKSSGQDEITATGLAPGEDREPAIIATLTPGNYTAVLSGTEGGTGIGILEIYDLDLAADSKLANLSTRAFCSTGDDMIIAGFTVGKETGLDDIIVRGLSPSLSYVGVYDHSIDPALEVRNSNGATLAANDLWTEGNDREDVRRFGLEPVYYYEPIIFTSLGPGAYTALLSPSRYTASPITPGIALIEIYSRGRAP